MEMADISKLDMSPSYDACGKIEEKMGTQKISVADHVNGFQYKTEKSDDSFVIDMDNFSHGNNKDITANSRIKLLRSLSKKGSQHGVEKKINDNVTSPTRGSSMPEKPVVVAVGPTDHASNPQMHHQITITTGNITATTESRFALRRNSFKRSAPSWGLDPKRVLLFFATLSSMGTIILIYFTLSISKFNANDNALD